MADEQGATTDSGGPPVASVEVVRYDLLCLRCGYNLRTLSLSGRCPECGTRVAESWTPAPPLLWADKEWLARVRRGMSLILLSLLAGVIVMLAAVIGAIALFAVSGARRATPTGLVFMPEMWFIVTAMVLSTGLFILGAYAVVRATSPEPDAGKNDTDPSVRRYCRRLLVAWIVLTVISWPMWLLVGGFDPHILMTARPVLIASMAVGMVSSVFMLMVWVCMTLFWRTLAVRGADRSLAGQTKAVVWCITVAACLFIVSQIASFAINPVWGQTFAATGPAGGAPSTVGVSSAGYGGATSVPTTTGPATMPASMPFTPGMGVGFAAFMAVACLTGVVELAIAGFGIWWVVLVFRYRSLLGRVLESTADADLAPEAVP